MEDYQEMTERERNLWAMGFNKEERIAIMNVADISGCSSWVLGEFIYELKRDNSDATTLLQSY